MVVRQLTISTSFRSSCSLCVYCGYNNRFYCHFPCNLFFLLSIKTKHTGKKKKTYLSEKYKKFCHLSEGVLVYVLSIASLFYLFNTAMFCGNTRGKLPENQQLRKGKKTGLHKLKPKDSTLQLSRMVALEYNHTKDLKKKKRNTNSGPANPYHFSLFKLYEYWFVWLSYNSPD